MVNFKEIKSASSLLLLLKDKISLIDEFVLRSLRKY